MTCKTQQTYDMHNITYNQNNLQTWQTWRAHAYTYTYVLCIYIYVIETEFHFITLSLISLGKLIKFHRNQKRINEQSN